MALKESSGYNPAAMSAITKSFSEIEFGGVPASVQPRRDSFSQADLNVEARYQSIVNDPRLFLFANIPDRIIRCLNSFGAKADVEKTRAALLAYYIFIGVTDDAIDGGDRDTGKKVLARLGTRHVDFVGVARCADAEFMTEILKRHLPTTTSDSVRRKLARLYRISQREREARTLPQFVKARTLLGGATADISYLLVCGHLRHDTPPLRKLMRQVGAVGCLIDSLIDARNDRRAGLLSFQPRISDWLLLSTQTFLLGIGLVWRYPRLIPLFCGAITDNVCDRKRSTSQK